MKKEWKNPIVMELGVENTLCGDALLLHGNNNQKPPVNGNMFTCHYCSHWCPTEKQREDHIKTIHGAIVATS